MNPSQISCIFVKCVNPVLCNLKIEYLMHVRLITDF